MKIVCVSDEVLNSQHYKHSQSTEASDQYANTRKIIYLKTAETVLVFSIFANNYFLFFLLVFQFSETNTYDLLHVI